MIRLCSVARAGLALAAASPAVSAQTVVFTHSGSGMLAELGQVLSACGDRDLDGVVDFALLDGGVIRIQSGASGALLDLVTVGVAATDAALAAAGDVNADGIVDLVLGAPLLAPHGAPSGGAFVYDGATGERIRRLAGSFPFGALGSDVAGAGDLDGDGHDDLIIGAAGETPGGAVYLVSGRSGQTLARIAGSEPAGFFGFAVAGLGDVTGDGVPDVAIGAPHTDANGLSSGSVHVHSGADGAFVRVHEGLLANDQLGTAVAAAGDVDGDGRPDVMAGAPIHAAARGEVRVWSGASGALLLNLVGDLPDDRFGAALCGGGRLDADGLPDLAIGAPTSDTVDVEGGSVHFYSGLGQFLGVLHGPRRGERLGSSVAFVADASGDGYDEVLVGAPGADPQGRDAGLARVVSARTIPPPPSFTRRPYCQGDGQPVACPCGNSSPGVAGGCAHSFGLAAELDLAGITSLSHDTLTLFARDLPPGIAILMQGDRRKPSSGPSGVPFGDGLLCVGGTTKRIGVLQASDGTAVTGFGVLGSSSLALRGQIGGPFAMFYQVLYRNPGAYCTPGTFNLTNALELHWVQ